MNYVIKLSGLAAAGALAIVGCGGTAAVTHTAKPAAASAAARPAATVNSCQPQLQAWAHPSGLSQMTAVGTDTGKISSDAPAVAAALASGADPSAALAALTVNASQLGADSQTALANQPPACIPGEAVPYRAAMAEYNQASQDTLTAVSEIDSGSYAGAGSMMNAVTTALDKGNADLGKATTAINAFDSAGG